MTRNDRLQWRYRGPEDRRVPFLREHDDGLPPLSLAPIDLPDSARPLYPGLALPTGPSGECRAELLFVHQDNLELTARFLIDDGATAITFWDGTTALDYQVPTDDAIELVDRLTKRREWLLRTDTGSVRRALGEHLSELDVADE